MQHFKAVQRMTAVSLKNLLDDMRADNCVIERVVNTYDGGHVIIYHKNEPGA